MDDWLRWLCDTGPFLPRAACGKGWTSGLVSAHIVSDEVIFICYLYLPAILAVWWRYRWHLSKTTLALWLGFILTCGMTHQSDVLMFTHPWYRLHAGVKLLCAAFSVAAVLWTSAVALSWRWSGAGRRRA